MFSATLTDVKLLRDSMDAIAQVIDEGVLRLKPEGLEMLAADRAMVAVVDFKLSANAFENYNCDAAASVGLNLLNFLTILKRAGNSDKLNLRLNSAENRLELTLTGESTRKFAIPLLELNAEDVPNITQFQFTANAELSTDVLSNGIDDADVIADSVMIELAPGKVRMWAEGDGSKTELNLESGSVALSSVDAKEAVKARYPLEYLKKIMKAAKLSPKTALKIGNDYPMRMDFTGDKVKMGFVLAPRVSEE
ncbi:MAG: proliferating cell nuclear antigen (pcna) [Candidatus Aenigmatarchaeota archaeon]